MADLDRDLSNRLGRLAQAVPVSAGRLDPVHRSAVAARQRVRMAWVTPLAVLVIGALVVGLAKFGSSGPGASAAPGGFVATDARGPFSLTIRSVKTVYRPDEPIDVDAVLAFAGPSASVTITHGLGVHGGPLGFGVTEPVSVPGVGWLQLGSVYEEACTSSRLERDAPLEASYAKGGSPLQEAPNGPTLDALQAFMSDPVLHLPAGTWHVYAVAEFTTAGCGASGSDRYQLRADITIVVADDPAATPGPPQPTPFLDNPVYGGDDIGNMTLQLKSQHATYTAGSPVELDTYYWFAEGPALAKQPFVQDVAISIVQDDPNAAVIRSVEPAPGCATTTVTPNAERHVPLVDRDVVLIKAASWPASSADALKRGILVLPVGHWRITAVVSASFEPCENPETTWQVHASVEIDVKPSQ
jgi:hypothetical protein